MEKTERDKWDALATRDKARYEIEKSTYKGPWKVAVTGRLAKDPKAPKRPMSAFLSFSSAKRSDVKELYPNIPNSEVSKLLSSWWRDAPKEEKRSYIDKELKLRQQYKVQTQTWKRKTTDAFNAARQAREDEALRVFDSGEPEPVTSNEGKEQYQACTAQPSPPNAPQNSEIAAPNCYYDGQPSRNVHWGPAQNNPVVSPENERSTYMLSVDPFPDQLQPLSYPDQLQPLSYSNQREGTLVFASRLHYGYLQRGRFESLTHLACSSSPDSRSLLRSCHWHFLHWRRLPIRASLLQLNGPIHAPTSKSLLPHGSRTRRLQRLPRTVLIFQHHTVFHVRPLARRNEFVALPRGSSGPTAQPSPLQHFSNFTSLVFTSTPHDLHTTLCN